MAAAGGGATWAARQAELAATKKVLDETRFAKEESLAVVQRTHELQKQQLEEQRRQHEANVAKLEEDRRQHEMLQAQPSSVHGSNAARATASDNIRGGRMLGSLWPGVSRV